MGAGLGFTPQTMMMDRQSVESANMEQSLDESPLRIREAVLRFCSGSKIEEVKKYEAYFTSAELEKFGYSDLSGAQRLDEPKHFDSKQMENRRRLNEAWDRVFLDFRARLERGEMVITGVKMNPSGANLTHGALGGRLR